MTKPDFESKDPRSCSRCQGAGYRTYDNTKGCHYCQGAGSFTAPDYKALVAACLATKGKNKGRLRASAPCNPYEADLAGRRAYYIWRLARFHGGADVTMPVTADLFNEGDPFKPEINAVSELVAKKTFGTDLAGAYRWASALGYRNPENTPPGLPDSAYEGGRVADGNKPSFELAELFDKTE